MSQLHDLMETVDKDAERRRSVSSSGRDLPGEALEPHPDFSDNPDFGEDFGDEPIFDDSKGVACIKIPGLPDSWISIKRSVDYSTSAGRSRYAEQKQRFTKDRKGNRVPDAQVIVGYDLFGLFLYKIENCLDHSPPQRGGDGEPVCGWQIKDPNTGQVAASNGNAVRAKTTFSSIKSAKLCKWISDKIDEVLQWNEEDESVKDRFSGEA